MTLVRELAVLLACVVGFASTAEAKVLPARASIRIELAELAPLQTETVEFDITVQPEAADVFVTRIEMPAMQVVTANLTLPVTDPVAAPISGLQATFGQLAGVFTAGKEVLGGRMPLFGVVRACLFATCAADPPAKIAVPVGVVGELPTAMGARPAAYAGSAVNVTVLGAPWTVQTTVVLDPQGDPLTTTDGGDLAQAGRIDKAVENGLISLVTPIFISTSIPGLSSIGAFGVLDINFVPEPGLLATHAVAVAALMVLGVRRLRR